MTPNAQMSFSAAGMRALKNYESFRAKPYDDKNAFDKNHKPIDWHPGMPLKGKLTVGYGRVLWNPAKDYEKYKDGITEAQATQMLLEDLRRFEAVIRLNVLVPLTQNEYDAIVIFVFNIGLDSKAQGISGFLTSTFLKFLNQGKKLDAANQMLRWVYSGREFLQGLLNRRQFERTIFLKGKYS
jgi:GH24 family phage-related lysozyme (muramidase)